MHSNFVLVGTLFPNAFVHRNTSYLIASPNHLARIIRPLSLAGPLTLSLNGSAQIPDRQARQIHRRKHDGQEHVPPEHRCREESAPRCDEQRAPCAHIAARQLPERTGREAEAEECAQEDQEEDHVGAEGADEEDEA